MDCFNIGYQGRSLFELCNTLSENAVDILIDVREHAWSQRPEFRKQTLQNTLARYGINYFHCKIAGNPFRPRNGERLDFQVCAKHYVQHLRRTPEVFDVLEDVIKNQRASLFCYEKERNCCHRDILLAALAKRNPEMKIIDLQCKNRQKPYEREEWQPIANLQDELQHYQAYATAAIQKNRLVSIELSPEDFLEIQQKALGKGVPCQTLIANIVHQFAVGRLVEQR